MNGAGDKHHHIRGVSRPLGAGDRLIAELADRQHGVVAYRQLVELGLHRRAVERRIEAGRLYRAHKGVYAVGRRTLPPKGHLMAAVLACGPKAVLSHRSAGVLWELRQSNQVKTDVTVPGGSRPRHPKIKLHRTRALHPEDIGTVAGIPVTSVPRTLLDLAQVLDKGQLTRVIEEAVRRRLFYLPAVDQAINRTPNRQGVKKLRQVLADYREPPFTRSELERRFFALIEQAGLHGP